MGLIINTSKLFVASEGNDFGKKKRKDYVDLRKWTFVKNRQKCFKKKWA